MDIEAIVAERISEAVGVPAYLEVPPSSPTDFITVEMTGCSGDALKTARLDIDCWSTVRGGGRKRAREMAMAVEAAVPSLDEEPNVFGPTVENTYRMADPDTGRPRYTVQVQMGLCE